MPTRTTPWPAGTPCWIDLASTDLPAARTFYAEVFGWTVPAGPPEAGGYSSATLDGHRDYDAAVPTPDHYLPLLYSAGLAQPDEPVSYVHEEVLFGGLSMRTFQIG